MRIIAGEAKNRIIKTRKGFDTRPTLESVKESLFSIIAPYVENSVFLDLFSGSCESCRNIREKKGKI